MKVQSTRNIKADFAPLKSLAFFSKWGHPASASIDAHGHLLKIRGLEYQSIIKVIGFVELVGTNRKSEQHWQANAR
jgi:hypothetical protein